ncbi:MAG: polymer-forming cytoskeletal protein [Porticoccaceae bacterium]|nr:polymer-forming cytoskeletal protein [Porticoccaceae bacterium]
MFDKLKSLGRDSLGSNGHLDAGAKVSKDNVVSYSGGSAMIGPGVQIEGQIVSDENLVIEGKVSGSITANSNQITVGKTGSLTANISAKVVHIEGTIKGDISGSEKVVISKTGNVLGNIQSPRVTLEDGAKFKGSIEMDPDEKTQSELPVTSASGSNARRVETVRADKKVS